MPNLTVFLFFSILFVGVLGYIHKRLGDKPYSSLSYTWYNSLSGILGLVCLRNTYLTFSNGSPRTDVKASVWHSRKVFFPSLNSLNALCILRFIRYLNNFFLKCLNIYFLKRHTSRSRGRREKNPAILGLFLTSRRFGRSIENTGLFHPFRVGCPAFTSGQARLTTAQDRVNSCDLYCRFLPLRLRSASRQVRPAAHRLYRFFCVCDQRSRLFLYLFRLVGRSCLGLGLRQTSFSFPYFSVYGVLTN